MSYDQEIDGWYPNESIATLHNENDYITTNGWF
jgi:hypothetical protein